MVATWVCCQLGAREHYSIPRALQGRQRLGCLITDAWASGRSIFDLLPATRGRERFHPDLSTAAVCAYNLRSIAFEAVTRPLVSGWPMIERRNTWFQRRALQALRDYCRRKPTGPMVLFAYSYAARRLFELAKQEGWTTVLGQIDPGPFEERLVGRLHEVSTEESSWTPAAASYWEDWRREVALSDHIVVNSEWSRRALASEGVPEEKLRMVPLVYEAPDGAKEFRRVYPRVFDESRPLRVLFLGQVNVRKGLSELLPAMLAVADLPVEFHFVGPMQIGIPAALLDNPRVRWHGPVSRSVAAEYYRGADVFLFPTLSDGFGITQLEAQAWRLPVIASPYCGDVVRHLENGYLLPAVTPTEIEKAIRWMLANPEDLARMSAASGVEARFSLARVGQQLDALVQE